VVLLNAVATAYGYAQLDRLGHVLRWDLLPAAVQAPLPYSEGRHPGKLGIELWCDYTCAYCQNSAEALVTIREEMREEPIAWDFRFLPRATDENSLGLQLALSGFCSQQPWLLFSYMAGEDDLRGDPSRGFLDRFGPFPREVLSCITSSAATDKIWQDRLEAARRGIRVTPTLIVDGVTLEGELHVDPVASLIQDRLRRRSER
jgi:hypothetical protein